jgi:membrane protease YdiL (CAAX protease family)
MLTNTNTHKSLSKPLNTHHESGVNATRPAPMSFSKSLPYFGFPWFLFTMTTYLVIPALSRARVPLLVNFLVSLGIPLGCLILAALVAYQRDGGAKSWSALRCRFRLEPIQGTTWWWTLGLSIFVFLAPAFLDFSAELIQKVIPIPDSLSQMLTVSTSEFMGIPLAGKWWLVLVYLAYTVLNVTGEELWWRGYILPRQERSLGKWTWFIHGLLWNLFHSFFYWELIKLLPGCLALSYVAQKSKNTWPGIIAHLANSLPGLILIVIGVLQ